MMTGMARVHPGSNRPGSWAGGPGWLVRPALVCLGLLLSALMTGCNGEPPQDPADPGQESRSVALRVSTVSGAEELDASARTRLEEEVGDVLSAYVVSAFLGTYPRDDFVGSFGSFTSGAARSAVRDLDLLTANRYGEAEDVRATRLVARLSFAALKDDAIGATAGVRFAFEATQGGKTRPISLRGQLLLVKEGNEWSVFGYDVARDDGATGSTGSTS